MSARTTIEKIRDDRRNGMSVADIANKYGLPVEQVMRILRSRV